MTEDAALLLDLLNTRPVDGGVERDALADDRLARQWATSRGGVGTPEEAVTLRRVREDLTRVVSAQAPVAVLGQSLDGVHQRPVVGDDGLSWELVTDDDARLSVRAVLAWAWVHEHLPGRLRACDNDECRLFLLDRSRANRARWCSMATCGNRMKARRHSERHRAGAAEESLGEPRS